MRIGVLGGTFDPVHIAHLAVAVEVRHALAIDRMLLVVANVPWQKAGERQVSDAEARYEMVAAAVAELDGVEASRIELDRGGESYTIDTLEVLEAAHPDAELFLVVGSDVAARLDTWVRPDDVRRLATIVVVDRPGTDAPVPDTPPGMLHVPVPCLDVSSSDLRARARDGRPIDVLVPPGAVHVVRKRGLYAG